MYRESLQGERDTNRKTETHTHKMTPEETENNTFRKRKTWKKTDIKKINPGVSVSHKIDSNERKINYRRKQTIF